MDHNQINVSKDDLFGIAITPESILHAESEIVKNKIAVNALQILKKKVTENVTLNTSNTGISANMITKIAKAGIQLEDLRKVYSHGGYKGLLSFSAKILGTTKVLKYNYLQESYKGPC